MAKKERAIRAYLQWIEKSLHYAYRMYLFELLDPKINEYILKSLSLTDSSKTSHYISNAAQDEIKETEDVCI